MAKAKSKGRSKSSLKAPSMTGSMPEAVKTSPEDKAREERYRLEDDSRTVKNYLDLKNDPSRYGKTVSFIRKQAADLDSLEGKESLAPRKAKRSMARKSSRGSRRR